MRRLAISIALLLVVTALPALASESESSLPGGTPIKVTVDAPIDGTEYVLPPGGVDVSVEGTASIGYGTADLTITYVVDVSGSVNDSANGNCGGDVNDDGLSDTILDCEIAAVLALNAAAASSGWVDEVGLAVYGRYGAAADMSPIVGIDPTTSPSAGPAHVYTVATSVVASPTHAGPTDFTAKHVNRANTNFAEGLGAAGTIVGASTSASNLVVFLSDGRSNDGAGYFGANLGELAATGAVVHTFAVGQGSSCSVGSDGTLQEIANATNGTCTEVQNPADLAGLVSGLLTSELHHLELTVDGGSPTVIPNSDISTPLPHAGPLAVTYSTPVTGLGVGEHTMCVTAVGSDAGGGGDSGEACTTVFVYGIDLTPETATKELGTDTTHTVTATIEGLAGTVGGRDVTFTVIDGPNHGATGSGTTGVLGGVPWTYTNTGAGGTDTIEACFTVEEPSGQTGCATATVRWADTTPPLAACMPGPNPHGDKIPPAGSSSLPGPNGGQNEDGFYDLAASDAVDPNPDVFVVDEGTGYVFGPYAAGTKIKWTQAPGAEPTERPIGSVRGEADAVAWHLTGQGDMLVYATDASGNSSSPLVCLVPPLPK
ncbi:MAG: vWA domain-containing protein [Actinomycetota bacterium]